MDSNVSLPNTCAFDSIFQVCLSANQDRQELKEFVVEETEHTFHKLLKSAQKKGITQYSYKLRAEISSDIFTATEITFNVKQIDCCVTSGTICKLLFEHYPSFIEILKCSKNCPLRYTNLQIVTISNSSMNSTEWFKSALQETICLDGPRPCATKDCSGYRTEDSIKTGKLIIIEVVPRDGNEKLIKLKNIPSEIKLDFMEKKNTKWSV